MSRKKKIWIICGAAVLLAIIVIVSVKSSGQKTIPVQTSKVQRKDVLTSKVNASGSIRAKEFVDIQAEIAGIVTEISAHEGATVKKVRFSSQLILFRQKQTKTPVAPTLKSPRLMFAIKVLSLKMPRMISCVMKLP